MTGSAEKRGCIFSKVNLVIKFGLKPLPQSGRKLGLVTIVHGKIFKEQK